MADTPNIYEDETGAPEAAPINWAMTDWMTQLSAPNTSLNTNPEFLAAAEADYNRIHGEGAWAAHVESTRQDLQDDADSFWDFFDNGDEALAAFDPDELLTQWARNDFASERLRPEEQAREFQSYPRNVQDLIENGSSQDLMSAALHYATYASRGAIALQGFENGQMTPEAIETIRRDMDVYDGLSDKLWGLAAERIDADANISRLMADKNSAFLITGARGLARDNPNMNAEDIRDLGVMSAIYARVKGAAETGYSDNLAARIERQLLPPVDERSDADNALLAQVQELETFISTIPDDPSELVEATENFESREAMRSFFDDTAQNYGYDGSIFTQASRPTESELANNESFQKAAHILFERETGQSWDQAGGNNEYDAATIGEWGLEFMSEERNQLWEVISQAGSLYLSDSFTMDQKMAYMYASETFDLTRDDFGTFKRAAWNTITDEANVVSLAAAALSVVTGGASSAGVEAAKRAGQKGFMTAVRNQVMNETREAAAQAATKAAVRETSEQLVTETAEKTIMQGVNRFTTRLASVEGVEGGMDGGLNADTSQTLRIETGLMDAGNYSWGSTVTAAGIGAAADYTLGRGLGFAIEGMSSAIVRNVNFSPVRPRNAADQAADQVAEQTADQAAEQTAERTSDDIAAAISPQTYTQTYTPSEPGRSQAAPDNTPNSAPENTPDTTLSVNADEITSAAPETNNAPDAVTLTQPDETPRPATLSRKDQFNTVANDAQQPQMAAQQDQPPTNETGPDKAAAQVPADTPRYRGNQAHTYTPDQADIFTPSRLSRISDENFRRIQPDTLKAFSAEQRDSLSRIQNDIFMNRVAPALQTQDVANLDAAFIRKLNPSHIENLNADVMIAIAQDPVLSGSFRTETAQAFVPRLESIQAVRRTSANEQPQAQPQAQTPAPKTEAAKTEPGAETDTGAGTAPESVTKPESETAATKSDTEAEAKAKAEAEAETKTDPEAEAQKTEAESNVIEENFASLMAKRDSLDKQWAETGFQQRKMDPKDLYELYKDLDDAINNGKMPAAKRQDLAVTAANAIHAAVQQGWHPEEMQRLVLKSRVAGLRHDIMKHLSGSGTDSPHTKLMAYGGYRTELYDHFVRPLLVVDGAAGIRADKFLLQMDGFRPGAKSDLKMRSNLEIFLKDIPKLMVPRAIGYYAHPQSMVTMRKNIGYMFGRHFNEEGDVVNYSLGHALKNTALNLGTFGMHRYADKLITLGPMIQKGVTPALMGLAAFSAYDGWDGERDYMLSYLGAPSEFMITDVGMDYGVPGIIDTLGYNGFSLAANTIGPQLGWEPDLSYSFDGSETFDADMITQDHWARVYPGWFGDGEESAQPQRPFFPIESGTQNGAAPTNNTAGTPAADTSAAGTPAADTSAAGTPAMPPATSQGANAGNTGNTPSAASSFRSAAGDINAADIQSKLPVTVQKLLTRENKETMSNAAASAGNFLSGIGNTITGLFRNMDSMLGSTWGPVASVGLALVGGMIGLNFVKGIFNFFKGGGVMKLGMGAALAVGGLYAFEHFSGARDRFDQDQDRDPNRRNGESLTVRPNDNPSISGQGIGRETLQRDHRDTYQDAINRMDLNARASAQGNGNALPNNVAMLAGLDTQANHTNTGELAIEGDFRTSAHHNGDLHTLAVISDASGATGIHNMSEIALNGMTESAAQGYTFAAGQTGLGFDGAANIAASTAAATGSAHLPNQFAALLDQPAAIRFDTTAHNKDAAIANAGWNADVSTPAIEREMQHHAPVSFNSLA